MEKLTEPAQTHENDQTKLSAKLPISTSSNFNPGLILADTLRLERLLGKGGMGEVWLATHLLLNEPRAIKVILSAFALNPQIRERFIRGEARNALKLNHPNIVRTYDLSQYGDAPYIVMEYVSGSDLKSLLKARGPFTLENAGELLMQIANALDTAHRQGLVHRDLKPANILLTDTGIAKISDFGLVKDVSFEQSDLSTTGNTMGTPLYMAPEQALGHATIASDIYALGVMLYEILTGKLPFSGSAAALLIQHATALPTPPDQLNLAIPKALSEVILQTLAKNPTERPPSALALAIAYQKAVSEQSVTIALPTSIKYFRLENDSHNVPPSKTNSQDSISVNTLDAIPNNLPLDLNTLIGRKTELTEICSLLEDKRVRLVTLTGVGGTGKTRLSLEVAQKVLADFPDGVYFLALENVTEKSTLINEIATILNLKETADTTLLKQLKTYLADKQMLMVLDNFEQLIESGATLLPELLKTAPKLKLLVSSREILNLSQEREYQVEPLDLPQSTRATTKIENLFEYSAIALFCERAKMVKSSFSLNEENAEVVIEICRKLDGLPLAIELAANKVRTFTLANLLIGLNNKLKLLTGGYRDLPLRQQTLRAAIDWSYELLEPAEQLLFNRLAIFTGGCTYESAEAVCNADGELEISVFEGLEALVNKSLLKRREDVSGETRFTMLMTIREYGLEKLIAEEKAILSDQHTTYFLKQTEEIRSKPLETEQFKYLKILDSEYDNIRTALEWAINQADSERALRLGGAIGRYWTVRGYYSEGSHYLTLALALKGELISNYRAHALYTVGSLVIALGDIAKAQSLYEEALALYRELNDEIWTARILVNLGSIVSYYFDDAKGRPLLEEALEIFRRLGDKQGSTRILKTLGGFATERGDYVTAQSLLDEALEIFRELDDKFGIVDSLISLGWLTYYQGNYASMKKFAQESLTINREIGGKRRIAQDLDLLGCWAGEGEGDFSTAQSFFEESLTIYRELNAKEGIVTSLNNLGEVNYLQGNYSTAQSFFEASMEISRKIDKKKSVAFSSRYLGLIAYMQGDYSEAQALLQEALATFQELGDKFRIATTLKNLGYLALQQEDYVQGQKSSEESLKLGQEIRSKRRIADALSNLGWLAFAQSDYITAQRYFNESYQLNSEMVQKQALATAENNLGLTALQQGNYAEAKEYLAKSLKASYGKSFKLELLTGFVGITEMQANYLGDYSLAARFAGIVEALRETMEIPLEPLIAKSYSSAVANAKTNLGEEVYATTFSEGKAMSLADAVEYVLETLTADTKN